MASLGDVWHVPYIVLASLYALVLIWATLQLVKLSFLSTALVGSPPNMKMRYELCISSVGGKRRVDCRGRFGTKSLFHALLALSAAARVASFVCECVRADMLGEPPKSPMHFDFTQWWLYVLGTIPPLLFFSVVTLLVTFWTQVWVDSNELAAAWVKAARVACACCNVALYLGNVAYAIAVYAVWPAEDGGAPDEVVPLWLYVAAFAMVSFGCLVVGWVIHRELNKVPIRLAIRTRKVRQVFIVTFVTFICFFARAIAVAVLAALPKSDLDFSPVAWAAIGTSYYVLLEIAPCVALLLYFCRTPVRLSQRQSAILDKLEANLLLPFEPEAEQQRQGVAAVVAASG